ncbi:hypothetical protein M441DRAFT_46943 [Trichoderma asperellum CBS 433.97]|uniref:Glycoside hydrolase family 99 protein n=1 Tax=Trichoderma asperellum (strain ATCC 204424 / CBS 433.97 / NBRC 101777) TaxID=1042311 RepID=A0A2T3ZAK2_TRIA4|nr:hypothetical protein M441DRAFT_46943 [Trichoderma asperellum CBS 433.97]PTB41834.1 hypothetical protein M441DRAFT_46943 [Trichoderma asperellum CBS 433.97]
MRVQWLFIPALSAAAEAIVPRAAAAVDSSTIQGKYMFGYQGWFRSPNKGLNTHWSTNGGAPGPGNAVFDFFPDTSAYPSECLFDTGFEFANGTTAKLYDNTCAGVVDLHFKWMQQYGIDGVLVQRFYGALSDATFLTVLDLVQASAEKYGRVFAVEYDLSGGNSSQASVTNKIIPDYVNNIKKYTSSPAYVHQDGKPVVMAFGFGVAGRDLSASDAFNLVRDLQAEPAYVILGTTNNWAADVRNNNGLVNTYKLADAISPWTVGAYTDAGYLSYNFHWQQNDTTLTDSLGKGYVPVAWPGTSNYHLTNKPANLDYFPRYNGSFYELQVNTVMKQKPLFIYTAMFDEVNEGTGSYACLKTSQLPTNEKFVGLDNDFTSTNHYFELAQQLATSFRALQ